MPAMLNSKTQKSENGGRIEQHLLITRYDEVRAKREEMLRIEDVLEFLPIPLLGIIPESKDVLRASNVGSPVTLSNKRSTAARAYIAAANKLNSERFGMVSSINCRKVNFILHSGSYSGT